MKNTLFIIIGIILLASIPLTYYAFHHHNASNPQQTAPHSALQKPYKKGPYQTVINKGTELYINADVKKSAFAQYLLLYKINQVTDSIPHDDLVALQARYKKDPFMRLIDPQKYVADIQFQRNMEHRGTSDFYTIQNLPGSKDTWDPILLKALYCDKTGYDEKDFQTLTSMRENVGGYNDTHYLFALIFLRENHCYNQNVITAEIAKTTRVLTEIEEKEKGFSDIYAERIVMLYWAGFGKDIQKTWIDRIAHSFTEKYGWDDKGTTTFTAHTTGFSLLALLYYTENKPQQKVY